MRGRPTSPACVDIHRKPGYDPVELFLDPAICAARSCEIGKLLLKKKLGLRDLMDVIPLDATLVKGSHGRDVVEAGEQPLILGSPVPVTRAEDVFGAIVAAVAP